MLKHRNPDRIHFQERPEKGTEKVIELPRPTESMERGDIERLVEQAAVKVADQYGHVVNQVMDNAKLNDLMLRASMQLPLAIQENPALFRDFLARISSRTNIILGKRGVQPEERSAFADRMRGLESSVYQLSKFVRAGRAKNPDFRFATSVWIDVMYGFDLLRAWPIWVPEKQSLDIFVTGYQAKANRGGLEPADVRELAARYGRQKERAGRELEFDPDWVFERMVTEMDWVTQRNVDMALRDMDRARTLLGEMTEDKGTPFERWRAAYVRSQLADRFASELGMEPAERPAIRQRGQEVNLRFLVDTKKGLEDLTEEQARTYGKAA